MQYRCSLVVLVALSLPFITAASHASDRIGVYALVDKVEFIPNVESPTQAVVHGTFCLAVGPHGSELSMPKGGFLLLGLDGDRAEQCRNEWRDLERVAGKGVCVAFGSRRGNLPRIHTRRTAELKPDPHPEGGGVRQMRDGRNYGPWLLRHALTPISPSGDAVVASDGGINVILKVKNCLEVDPEIRYLFQIQRENGEAIASGLIPVGEGTTWWATYLVLNAGETVRWTARAVKLGDARSRYPVATARFKTVKKKPEERSGKKAQQKPGR